MDMSNEIEIRNSPKGQGLKDMTQLVTDHEEIFKEREKGYFFHNLN